MRENHERGMIHSTPLGSLSLGDFLEGGSRCSAISPMLILFPNLSWGSKFWRAPKMLSLQNAQSAHHMQSAPSSQRWPVQRAIDERPPLGSTFCSLPILQENTWVVHLQECYFHCGFSFVPSNSPAFLLCMGQGDFFIPLHTGETVFEPQ